jgi:hypothetical protein
MGLLVGIIIGSFFNFQEKFHYCKDKIFDGKYCETAYVLHERDVESGNCDKRREDSELYCQL